MANRGEIQAYEQAIVQALLSLGGTASDADLRAALAETGQQAAIVRLPKLLSAKTVIASVKRTGEGADVALSYAIKEGVK